MPRIFGIKLIGQTNREIFDKKIVEYSSVCILLFYTKMHILHTIQVLLKMVPKIQWEISVGWGLISLGIWMRLITNDRQLNVGGGKRDWEPKTDTLHVVNSNAKLIMHKKEIK